MSFELIGPDYLPPIWRAVERTRAEPGVRRTDEVIYDETPGFVCCIVRSWLFDGYTDWDFRSRRFEKTDEDGGWRRVR